jgi:hypothetical protein
MVCSVDVTGGATRPPNRADWRPQLLAVLRDRQAIFPEDVRKKKSRLSVSSVATAGSGKLELTEDDFLEILPQLAGGLLLQSEKYTNVMNCFRT